MYIMKLKKEIILLIMESQILKKNVILFNTNETIKNIRFFSTNSLLIITEKSAFKLCLFAKDIEIFFTLNLIYTCGLCKDLFSDKIYKYYNENKCYEKKPNNSIYLNVMKNIILKMENV